MDIVRNDGSIYHQNIGVNYRKKLTTQYTITPSPEQKIQLANAGLQWVTSSNVSGVGIQDDDLIIRFQNGSLYAYSGQSDKFDNVMKAQSKGHWVWVNLRRKPIQFKKIGSLKFKDDKDVTDEDIFSLVDKEGQDIQRRLLQMGLFIPEQTNVLNLLNLSDLL